MGFANYAVVQENINLPPQHFALQTNKLCGFPNFCLIRFASTDPVGQTTN
jgi:hypothetical protein